MGGCSLSNYYQSESVGTKETGVATPVSSAAFNWDGTKRKTEVVQHTDFNPSLSGAFVVPFFGTSRL